MMRMITPLVAVPGSFLAGLCAPARALGSQRDSTAGSFSQTLNNVKPVICWFARRYLASF